ncbi:hypothetical protein K466DRAFT_365375 [Polyporus arcularius HHB13444]|uniref:F-box domain-containing protein n=1 Tax=Polyporus arcularius HHB13444 TaxID=1314778 RepID=A0A5C3PR08_9APHY|nr:hypothetical protein K466DRAFT_365375 [Polyporus arcularius HHB13444]
MSDWKVPFKRGVSSFRAGNYEDAVARFSEAIELGGDVCTVCDARAAVYQKLGKLKEALRDSKSVIDSQPGRWQGYARSARLFLQIKKFDAASRMVELALERVPPEQSGRRDEMVVLQAEIRSAHDEATQEADRLASLRAYHFGKLPVEIAHTMFSRVLAEDHAYVVTLARVCKNWRGSILGTPAYWGTLVLSNHSPKRKIKTWKERSKNRIRELAILQHYPHDSPAHKEELRTIPIRHLRVLRLEELPPMTVLRELPLSLAHTVIQSLSGWPELRPLSLRGEIDWEGNVPTFRCRDFTVGQYSRPDWSELSSCLKDLRSCTLDACFGDQDWPHLLWFLHSNPALEQLSVATFYPTSYDIPDDREIPPTITLPRLSELRLTSTIPERLFPLLNLPSLKSLYFVLCRVTLNSALQHITSGPASTLTTLSIQSASFLPETLLSVLATTTALETLHIIAVGFNTANVVLEGLSRPPVAFATATPQARTPPLQVYCPALRHLDCSHNQDVKGGPLVRLVKWRLAEAERSTAASSEGDGSGGAVQPVQRLETLEIDGCPLVDPAILPWLREKVPVVSCVYQSKKAAGWKR